MQQLISLQKLHAKPLMDNNAILLQNGNLNSVHSLTTFNFKDQSMNCRKMAFFVQLKQF
jgi:hypothetical protein